MTDTTKIPNLPPNQLGATGMTEQFLAPSPPEEGKIIGVDCHPDIFTATAFSGTTPHNAKQLKTKVDVTLAQLLRWLESYATPSDIILMEAGSNSFDLCRRLIALGLRACVLESAWVGKQATSYVDNDKIAAARIVRVYLQGNCPAVWIPDETTSQRRELLHIYEISKRDSTQAINSLRGYLTQYAVRPGQRNLTLEKNQKWVLKQREWSPMQLVHLDDYFSHLRHSKERRLRIETQICIEVTRCPQMLSLMSLLGIGRINAFALIATIGDITRFANPKKLVSYLGLNPGQKTSGLGKHIKVGMGKRGRKGMRNLLIQGAHAILRQGSRTPLSKWGMSLFLRKGHRNIAVAAVARKLAMQVWHLLMGNQPQLLEATASRLTKFTKLLTVIGKEQRSELNLPITLKDCIAHLDQLIANHKTSQLQKINLE